MAVHTEISPAQAADRLAIRELVDAYAHCADRRDGEGQKALFTTGTRFAAYGARPGRRPRKMPTARRLTGTPAGSSCRLRSGIPREAGHRSQRLVSRMSIDVHPALNNLP
jgi:SnoaL-like domain